MEEYELVSGSYVIRKVYFDGLGMDEHLGYAVTSNGQDWTRYTVVQDPQGNVVRVLNQSGTPLERYEYDPYGNQTIWSWDSGQSAWVGVLSTQIHNKYGYTGRRHDPETGFMYYRNRYYWPTIGRFLTEDPIGNWTDGGNWGNGYAYVGNGAHSFNDPSGLYLSSGNSSSLEETAAAERDVFQRLMGGDNQPDLTGVLFNTDPQGPASQPASASRFGCQVQPNRPASQPASSPSGQKLTEDEVNKLIEYLMSTASMTDQEREGALTNALNLLHSRGALSATGIAPSSLPSGYTWTSTTSYDKYVIDNENLSLDDEMTPGIGPDQTITFNSQFPAEWFDPNQENRGTPPGLVAASVSVLIHELVHANQSYKRKDALASCDNWKKIEREALQAQVDYLKKVMDRKKRPHLYWDVRLGIFESSKENQIALKGGGWSY